VVLARCEQGHKAGTYLLNNWGRGSVAPAGAPAPAQQGDCKGSPLLSEKIRWNYLRKGGEPWTMSVKLRPGESPESLLRRFRKAVAKGNILSTYRKKRWFVSKSELRRKQRKKAIRRLQRKMQQRQR